MNWYIGQEIVCIKTHSQGVIKRGQAFTIKAVRESQCSCDYIEIDIGIRYFSFGMCVKCGYTASNPEPEWWFSERNFAPLEYNQQAIDELLEQPCEV